MPRINAFLLTLLVATSAQAAAQGERLGLQVDQISRLVFPPNLVIRNQREIGLSEAQRQSFVAELQATQSDLLPLQLDLSGAGEELAQLLMQPRVDEARAVELTERMLELEAQIKRRHMRLLVRVKNLLSEEQQRRLRELRRGQRRMP